MKHQFEEYVTINSNAIPAFENVILDKHGNLKKVYYEWDENHKLMTELFTKKSQVDKNGSLEIKSKADNFKKLGVKCFPGNVLKRIFDDNKKISHFIVEVSFDHDKTPESHRWKFWKVPFGLTRRINHITSPVC